MWLRQVSKEICQSTFPGGNNWHASRIGNIYVLATFTEPAPPFFSIIYPYWAIYMYTHTLEELKKVSLLLILVGKPFENGHGYLLSPVTARRIKRTCTAYSLEGPTSYLYDIWLLASLGILLRITGLGSLTFRHVHLMLLTIGLECGNDFNKHLVSKLMSLVSKLGPTSPSVSSPVWQVLVSLVGTFEFLRSNHIGVFTIPGTEQRAVCEFGGIISRSFPRPVLAESWSLVLSMYNVGTQLVHMENYDFNRTRGW